MKPTKSLGSPQKHGSKTSKRRYPKPGPTGGKLIRQLIANLKAQGLELPLDQNQNKVLIAVSGGADSTALAHLLAKYGRKIVTKKRNIRLLHVNHGWRGQDSETDALFVKQLAKTLGVGFTLRKMPKQAIADGESWENVARKQRKRFFRQQAEKHKGIVLTAHQADDVAETLLWRIFTGQAETHAGGIAVRHGVELRPLLSMRKKDLKHYLKEEGQDWREDSTNHGGRFLRSRLRLELMPILEHIFPKAVDHLGALAQRARNQAVRQPADLQQNGAPVLQAPVEALFGAAGLTARRPHYEFLKKAGAGATSAGAARITLPGGWTLLRDAPETRTGARSDDEDASERWILQKDKSSEA